MKHLSTTFFAIIVCVVISACSSLAAPTITPTPTLTNTQAPTATSTSTPIPTPTATPTPVLPVSLTTPLPAVSQTFGISTANQIKLLSSYEHFFDVSKTSAIDISADGKFYFVASSAGVDIYDLATNQKIKRLNVIVDNWDSMSYDLLQVSADGSRFMARISDQKIAVFDLNGKQIYSYNLANCGNLLMGALGSVGFSPSGKYLAIADSAVDANGNCTFLSSSFKVIDVDSGNIIYEYGKTAGGEAHGELPFFSPDEKMMATLSSNSQISIWSTKDWKSIANFSTSFPFVNDQLAFSPDSSNLAIFSGARLTLWDIKDHIQLKTFTVCGKVFNEYQPIFSSDGAYIADMNCDKVDVWKTSDGSVVADNDISLYNYPRIFTLSVDGKLTKLEPSPNPDIVYPQWNSTMFNGGFRFVGTQPNLHLDFAGTQDIAASSKDQYGVEGNACTLSLDGTINCTQGNAILGDDGKSYQIISNAMKIELSPNDDSSNTPLYKINWGGSTFYPLRLNITNGLFFYNVYFESGGRTNGYATDLTTGSNIAVWTNSTISDIAYSPDGKLAALILSKPYTDRSLPPEKTGSGILIYDMAKRQSVIQITSPWTNGKLVFSPDGNYLYYYAEKAINPQQDSYEVIDLNQAYKYTDYQIPVIQDTTPTAFCISPDGTILALGYGDGTIRFFNTNAGTLIYEWKTTGSIDALAFSQDMKYLASGTGYGDIQIWGIWP